MAWRRLGLVFAPDGTRAWGRSHASNPTAELLDGGLVRVWFSTRDERQRSSITFVDIHIEGSERVEVVRVPEEPSLQPGPRGGFDDSGCSVGSVIIRGGKRWVYYMGWNLGVSVPFRGAIGVAVGGVDEGGLERPWPGPLLDRSREDPFSLSYPCVVPEEDGWRMYYGSHTTWGEGDDGMRHALREATSADGIRWDRGPEPILEPAGDGGELGFSRPWLDGERLWYAVRTQTYHIGCAERVDGRWLRRDETVAFEGEAAPWESTMQTYPSTFELGRSRYLLYNGDRYGRTGFGLAVEVAS